ncbi:hypothetical protein Hanom_Chr01g00043541 [Helianthus anomalus]
MILKNTGVYDGLTISQFIEKIESQDLEQQKIARMNSPSGQQDVKMYYRGSIPVQESDVTPRSPRVSPVGPVGDYRDVVGNNIVKPHNYMNAQRKHKDKYISTVTVISRYHCLLK